MWRGISLSLVLGILAQMALAGSPNERAQTNLAIQRDIADCMLYGLSKRLRYFPFDHRSMSGLVYSCLRGLHYSHADAEKYQYSPQVQNALAKEHAPGDLIRLIKEQVGKGAQLSLDESLDDYLTIATPRYYSEVKCADICQNLDIKLMALDGLKEELRALMNRPASSSIAMNEFDIDEVRLPLRFLLRADRAESDFSAMCQSYSERERCISKFKSFKSKVLSLIDPHLRFLYWDASDYQLYNCNISGYLRTKSREISNITNYARSCALKESINIPVRNLVDSLSLIFRSDYHSPQFDKDLRKSASRLAGSWDQISANFSSLERQIEPIESGASSLWFLAENYFPNMPEECKRVSHPDSVR